MVFQEFISPLLAELIVDQLNVTTPDTDVEGKPLPMQRWDDLCEDLVFERLEKIIPDIASYYNIDYAGTERMLFEWYPPECEGSELQCENSAYLKKKWLRMKNRDVTGMLFLSSYQAKVPFDNEFEVFGGKLQFPQHQFSFNPERGTLVLYPSGPHFINATSAIYAGDLFQVRIHIAAKQPYLYNPKEFPGDYREWFKEFA